MTAAGLPITRLVYEPRGAARELWAARDAEVLIEGPAGTGKTRGTLEKVLARADKYPNSRHLICRKTRASMTESVLVTFEEKVLPPGSPIKAGPQREHRQSYRLPNGSSIVVGGLDRPERTFSTEYDTVVVFEATEASEHEWESLHRALRNGKTAYHQAIADCNPAQRNHWLNQRANAKRMRRLLSRHEDNPEYHDGQDWTAAGRSYVLGTLENLTGVRRLRLRLGLWATAEGVIWEDFDPDVHVIDQMPAGWQGWRKVRSIDFGLVHPFVCQWWAVDGDGRMYRYRELYGTGRIVEDWAKRIVELSVGETIETTVCDHDAEDRATLARHGVPTVPADKRVKPGLEAVAVAMREQADKRRRIYFLRDARLDVDPVLVEAKKPTCTEQEIDGYVWNATKEEPVKENDDGCDATRYARMYVDRGRPVIAAGQIRSGGVRR